jgi:hypothetical protein
MKHIVWKESEIIVLTTVNMSTPYGTVKRLVNGVIVTLSAKENRKLNKRKRKKARVIYGHNTK